jgi:hypothetical protein
MINRVFKNAGIQIGKVLQDAIMARRKRTVVISGIRFDEARFFGEMK